MQDPKDSFPVNDIPVHPRPNEETDDPNVGQPVEQLPHQESADDVRQEPGEVHPNIVYDALERKIEELRSQQQSLREAESYPPQTEKQQHSQVPHPPVRPEVAISDEGEKQEERRHQPRTLTSSVNEKQAPELESQVPKKSKFDTARTKKGLSKIFAGFPKVRIPKRAVLVIGVALVLVALLLFVSKLAPPGLEGLLGKKVEIVWWGFHLDEDIVLPLIDKYEVENPNVDITYIKQSPVDYRERLTSSLASGKGPDIFEIHNSWPVMFKNELAALPSSVMSQIEFTQAFYPIAVSNLTTKKGIVGIPLEFDAITLFINEDIFIASAKSPPETWDELRILAKELTQKDENGLITQSGASLGITENVDHWPEIIALMMLQNGASLSKPFGKQAEDPLIFYSLFFSDGVWDEKLPPSTNAFARGKLAMYFGPTKRAFEITKLNPSLKFKTVPLPQLPKESPDEPDVSYATYWVQGVWERSKSKEECWKFLKFMSQRDSLDAIYKDIREATNIHKLSPRLDSTSLLIRDPIVGSVAVLVANSKSWYLADNTYDGLSGINSQINRIYEEVIGNGRVGATKSLEDASGEIQVLLSQYGIDVR
jgi:ABC-type glycerol-3-phosphate transport system substrate-binding protein